MRRSRILLTAVLVVLAFSAVAAAPASAEIDCQKCTFILFVGSHCDPAATGDSGKTSCTEGDGKCILSGTACTGTWGGGSGTGGGGGGGGTDPTCSTTGFCPAECFSCAGGGGRPPYEF